MLKTWIAAALALSATASMAAPVDVDFNVYFIGSPNTPVLTGTFAGTDSNNDGTLTFGELTSFAVTEDGNYGVNPLSLTDLVGFGDYNIATNTWASNGVSWPNYGNIAWFTWDGGNSSANPTNSTVSTFISSVPEPSTLAMMGLGAAALLARRKRRAA